MPKFLPVPWIQWQRHRVWGVVVEAETGRPLEGLLVNALDKDVLMDDYLGQCETNADGKFEIRFTDADFKDIGESKPDIYLTVFKAGSPEPIADTSCELREDASREEYFELEIPKAALE